MELFTGGTGYRFVVLKSLHRVDSADLRLKLETYYISLEAVAQLRGLCMRNSTKSKLIKALNEMHSNGNCEFHGENVEMCFKFVEYVTAESIVLCVAKRAANTRHTHTHARTFIIELFNGADAIKFISFPIARIVQSVSPLLLPLLTHTLFIRSPHLVDIV